MIIMGIHSKGGREKTIRSVLFIYIWSPCGIFKWISSKGCWLYEGVYTHTTHTYTHTHIYVPMADSLHYTAETNNIVKQLYSNRN